MIYVPFQIIALNSKLTIKWSAKNHDDLFDRDIISNLKTAFPANALLHLQVNQCIIFPSNSFYSLATVLFSSNSFYSLATVLIL